MGGFGCLILYRNAKRQKTHDPPIARASDKSTNEMVRVRREKALVSSGRQSRPETGSLHPVGIESVLEATKPLKPSMERIAVAIPRACRL